MRVAACLLAWSGCCTETYEVTSDTSRQPLATLTVGTESMTGTLATFPTTSGFTTRLAGSTSYQLQVPSKIPGRYTGTLVARRAEKLLTIYEVSIDTNVNIEVVCLDPDQNDYGTGRCRDSYTGTLELTGPDVFASWQLDQRAVVVPGTPDC